MNALALLWLAVIAAVGYPLFIVAVGALKLAVLTAAVIAAFWVARRTGSRV